MVTYVATLDVSRHVVDYLSRLLAAHRRHIGTPRGSRALGPFRQAVLVLCWFRERGCVHCLARDAGISQATGYRYLHEGIDILAEQALRRQWRADRALRPAMRSPGRPDPSRVVQRQFRRITRGTNPADAAGPVGGLVSPQVVEGLSGVLIV